MRDDSRNIGLLDDPDFISDLRGSTPQREIAEKWGIARSTVSKWRSRIEQSDGLPITEKIAALRSEFNDDGNGSLKYLIDAERIIPLSEWLEMLRKDGYDPADFDYNHGHSVWTAHTKEQETKTLYANRFSATKRTRTGLSPEQVLEETVEALRGYRSTNSGTWPLTERRSLIVCASDLQIGKTDIAGGTAETVNQVRASIDEARRLAVASNVSEIVVVDAGDGIENRTNVSSQLSTNDVSLPYQVVAFYKLMLEAITVLAPAAPRLVYVAVPSNHGRDRLGLKSPAGTTHDDWGIVVAELLRVAISLSPALAHVDIVVPPVHLESVAIETSGSRIGVVHGHQASSADKLPDWWRGQALGNQPTADCRLLLVGHYHNLQVKTVGDDRTLFVCPSSDRGSSWFTNIKGDTSKSGMLVFLTADNEWSNLAVV